MRHRALTGLSAAVAATGALLIGAGGAAAAPHVDGTFDVTTSPKYLTQGPDGNIWVTLTGGAAGNDVARITPAGVVTEFDAAALENAVGIAAGPDGQLWTTVPGGVASFLPSNPTGAVETPIATISDPRGITTGPDGALWAGSADQVVRIPPAAPATATATTVAGLGARGISADSEDLWIADFGSGRIVQFDPVAKTPTFYASGGNPQEVAAAPGVGQVAYGNPGSSPQTVGRITPGTPTPATTNVPLMTDPFGVALGGDGNWWFAQFAKNNLGRLTQAGGYTTLGGLPAGSGPRYITAGPGDTLWVGLETANKVARVVDVSKPAPPQSPPQTTIDSAPPNKLEAGRKGAKASFTFSSKPAMARFDCALKRKGNRNDREQELAKFSACTSPAKYRKLRKGKYTFKVRATVGALTDPSPARDKFKLVAR